MKLMPLTNQNLKLKPRKHERRTFDESDSLIKTSTNRAEIDKNLQITLLI